MINTLKITLLITSIFFIYQLISTSINFPILKAFTTKESSNAWLKTTIFDFYLEAIAFSMIIFYTEKKPRSLIWISAKLLLGSPVTVFYLFTKNKWKLEK